MSIVHEDSLTKEIVYLEAWVWANPYSKGMGKAIFGEETRFFLDAFSSLIVCGKRDINQVIL